MKKHSLYQILLTLLYLATMSLLTWKLSLLNLPFPALIAVLTLISLITFLYLFLIEKLQKKKRNKNNDPNES